jgi:hypothetical protein
LASSKFIESLVGVRAEALHNRLTREFGWTDEVTSDFLTQVGLGLLGGLRNHPGLDIARLPEEAEFFSWVTSLNFRALTARLNIEAGDAWRGARWAALDVVDAYQARHQEGALRLAGGLSGA